VDYCQDAFDQIILFPLHLLNFELNEWVQNLEDAAEIILSDRKHLDNNPHPVSKNDIIDLLKKINSTDV
jgi:hypothetical protein